MLKNIFLVLISIALVIFALELFSRKVFPIQNYYRQPMYQYDPMLGHSFRKAYKAVFTSYEGDEFTFTTNSEGWRGPEFYREENSKLKRIVFLGDSFLESAGARLEDTLPNIVESVLNKDVGETKYSCFNFAIGDIGQAEEYLIWKNYASKYRPDIVVLQLFLFNDVLNNSLYWANKSNSPGDYLRPYMLLMDRGRYKVVFLNPIREFFRSHSTLFRLAEIKILAYSQKSMKRAKEKELNQEEGQLAPQNLLFLTEDAPDEYRKAWRITENLILKIKRDVELNGARFYIISMPWLEQVYDKERVVSVVDEKNRKHFYRLNYDKPETELSKFFNDNNIKGYLPLYDLRNWVSSTGLSEVRDLWGDGHLNKKGLKIVGQKLAVHLKIDLGL